MLFAAAAMAFSACQKQEIADSMTSEEVTLTFASEKPAFDDETKTEWTGETIQWSAGDKISVAYTVAGIWQNASGDADGNAKIYQSNPISEATTVAHFNVSTYFTGSTEGTHIFYAVYPALGNNNFPDAPVANISVSPYQNPKAESFDSSADVMVGISGEYDERPGTGETISLKWDRLVAHAVITLKNINGFTSGESLKYITLTAQADANLVGQQKVDLVEKTVVKDNDAANVLKLSADNLSIADGTFTFWACVLPETITSLTVEVETDKATYTREITGISKEFKKNARNTLAVKMNEAVRVEKAVDNNVTDVLTGETTGVTGSSYVSWEGKTLTSGAVYAGQSAGSYGSIQLRSDTSKGYSGVISTTSGGTVKKVVVSWNSNTAPARTLNVYGSSSAYTSPSDLYNSTKQGTLLGTIVCGTSVELDVEGDYEYIGVRSASGAMYLDKIEITWTPAAPKENYLEVSTNLIEVEAEATIASFTVNSDLEWTATPSTGANVTTAEDGTTVNVSFETNKSTEETKTYTVTVSAEGVESQVVTITQKAYVTPSVIEEITVAEFLKKEVSTEVWYKLTGTIKEIMNTTYGNFYLEDETGYVYVYGLTATQVASNDKSFASLNLNQGDVLTLVGTRAQYASASVADQKEQVGGPAYYLSHVTAPYMELTSTGATVAANVTTQTIEVKSNCEWTANPSEGVTLNTASGSGDATITMTFAANETEDPITHTVIFTSGEITQTYTLTQKAPETGDVETAEPVTLIIDGSTLTSTATTVDSDHNFGGVTLTMSKGAKSQKSNAATNAFSSNAAILIGKTGAYIYNKTPIPGRIVNFEIYANAGASKKVSVGVNFSSTQLSSYSSSALNTYTATLSTLDSVYDCSNALPDDAQYFWYQVTNSNNSQVQFKITYIPEN